MPGTTKKHVCPKCFAGASSIPDFFAHIETHILADEPPVFSKKFRMEAILLGLGSAALWDFLKWCFDNTHTEILQFFGSDKMGHEVHEEHATDALKDTELRSKYESRMEVLMHFTWDESPIINSINSALHSWMLAQRTN